MRIPFRRLPVALAAALALGAGGLAATVSAAPRGEQAADPPGAAVPAGVVSGGGTVTLVTGDRVVVPPGAAGRVQVLPGPGRAGIRFRQYRQGADVMVVPADAERPLQAGRLDRRLFAVNRLIQFGYDDRSRPDLPLIVPAAATDPGTGRLAGLGAALGRSLPSVRAVAVRQDKRRAGALWAALQAGKSGGTAPGRRSAGISDVWLDGPVRPTLDQSVPQVGAPAAWQAGRTGAGTTVAVLDTGLDAGHPDLADAVAGSADFTGSPSGSRDDVGHGTHVASVITGSGAASGGQYAGVAPDTRLLVGKVLGEGGGTESMVIAGMEWAAGQHADVVNMSLGSPWPGDGTDPVEQAVNRLTAEAGSLFVVAAGNSGPAESTITSPATADAALAVGAVDKQDRLADFSGRGPRLGDAAVKPEVTAPGVGIVAARAAGTQLGEPVGDAYVRLSGTSMAAPHAAGAAAILAGAHPDWSPAELKAMLMGSAAPGEGTVDQQGAGRVDVARAVTGTVHSAPASIGLGVQRWPHTDDTPVATTVTYANTGTAAVTVDLAADVRGPGGAAPAGLATVSPARLAIPAGGRAQATLTIDTSGPGPDGRYGGFVTATGGGQLVRTPVAVTKEVESYDVTLSFLDHHGRPGELNWAWMADVDLPEGRSVSGSDPSGTTVLRAPKGRYFLDAWVETATDGPPPYPITVAQEPLLQVNADLSVQIDARDGRRPGVTVDKPGAALASAFIGHELEVAAGSAPSYRFLRDFDDVLVRPSRTVGIPGEFTFVVGGQLAKPDGTGGFGGSPYLYTVQWTEPDRVPADPTRRVRTSGLAVVEARLATPAAGKTGLKNNVVGGIPLPGKLTEYYTPGVPWSGSFSQFDPAADPPRDEAPLWQPLVRHPPTDNY